MNIDLLYFALGYCAFIGGAVLWWLAAARLNERYDRISP